MVRPSHIVPIVVTLRVRRVVGRPLPLNPPSPPSPPDGVVSRATAAYGDEAARARPLANVLFVAGGTAAALVVSSSVLSFSPAKARGGEGSLAAAGTEAALVVGTGALGGAMLWCMRSACIASC